jgi:hypothetical protein
MTKKRFRVNMFRIFPLLLCMTAIPTALILLFIYVAGKYSFGDDNILFAASMVVAFATVAITLLAVLYWAIPTVEIEIAASKMNISLVGFTPFYAASYTCIYGTPENLTLEWDTKTNSQYVIVKTESGRSLCLVPAKHHREDYETLCAELSKTNI